MLQGVEVGSDVWKDRAADVPFQLRGEHTHTQPARADAIIKGTSQLGWYNMVKLGNVVTISVR
jgi:hypothetical protein